MPCFNFREELKSVMEHSNEELRRWGIETNFKREFRLRAQTEKVLRLMIQKQEENVLELKFTMDLIVNEKERLFFLKESRLDQFLVLHFENGYPKDLGHNSYPNDNKFIFRTHTLLPQLNFLELENCYNFLINRSTYEKATKRKR